VLVVEAGQDAHRRAAVGPQDGAQAVQPRRSRQVQVEQHAVGALQLAAAQDLVYGLDDRELDARVDLGQQLAHEEGVAVVVLDEQDATMLTRRVPRKHATVLPLGHTQVPQNGR